MSAIRTSLIYWEKLIYILTKEQKKKSIFAFLFIAFSAVLEMIGVSIFVPYISAIINPKEFAKNDIVNQYITLFGIDDDLKLIVIMSFLVVLIYIFKDFLLAISDYVCLRYENDIQKEISVLMLGAYLRRPYEDILDINTAEVLRGISNDTTGIYYIISSVFGIVSRVLTIILIVLFLIANDPITAIFLLSFSFIVVGIIILKIKETIKKSGQIFNDAMMNCTKTSTQAINGIKEILVTRRNETFLNRYVKSAEEQRAAQIKYRFLGLLPNRVIEVVFISALILIVLFKIFIGEDIAGSIPALSALAVASVRILPYIANISTFAGTVIYYLPSLDNLYNNISKARRAYNNMVIEDKYKNITRFANRIDVSNVSWKYRNSEKWILSELFMSINCGEAVGIIGASGEGKSTLADIVLGLLIPEQGNISVDGINICDIPNKWSQMIGYIPQMPYLMDDSIKNNILFGDNSDDSDEKEIWEILKKVQLDAFVKELPAKLDTIVGERGIKLSGGQRQRLSIARVLYYNPDIIVMDEATSALDADTEQAVMDAIEGLHGSKTLIIIAHRITTLRMCDRIFRIEDGKATEIKYDEL